MSDHHQSGSSVLVPSRGGRRPFSCLDRVDPRLRIVMAVAFSVVVVMANRFEVPAIALAVAVLGFALSGVSLREAIRRLLPLNVLMLIMLLLLPLTSDGTPLFKLGPLDFSLEGLKLGANIAIKGNVVVLALLGLLGSLDVVTLGHALSHLHVPDKLTHLLLFTVRYLDVLHREYLRLRAAMKVRAFRPRISRHTYRTYGYLVGMLLVSSFDRSERIVAAMKCRGFQGRFYLLDHFAFSRRDLPFCLASFVIRLILILGEWR